MSNRQIKNLTHKIIIQKYRETHETTKIISFGCHRHFDAPIRQTGIISSDISPTVVCQEFHGGPWQVASVATPRARRLLILISSPRGYRVISVAQRSCPEAKRTLAAKESADPSLTSDIRCVFDPIYKPGSFFLLLLI